MTETFLKDKVTLHCGDCLAVLPMLAENSVDACVTDPPYHLTSIVKRFGGENAAPAQHGMDGRFSRLSGGFMNQRWDAPEVPAIDPCFANWMAGFIDGEGCFHVHKKNVNGCETYDCQFSLNLRADDKPIVVEMQKQLGGIGSIADRPKRDGSKGEAQVRYCISSKADCQRLRAVLSAFPLRAKKARDFEIWCHALDAWVDHQPGSSWEDVAYYRDALMAVRQYGATFHPSQIFHYRWARQVHRVIKPGAHLLAFCGTRTYHRMAMAIEDAGFEVRDTILYLFGSGFPKSRSMRDIGHAELGTALKPACEIICLARKPLSESVAANVLRWGVGALNIDGCRIPSGQDHADKCASVVGLDSNRNGNDYGEWKGKRTDSYSTAGRWPANLITDGSEEVLAGFPDGETHSRGSAPIGQSIERDSKRGNCYGEFESRRYLNGDADLGSAARFFYTAKADSDDRLGSKHPTVKPLDLMQYLIRLVCPKNGTVIDPFAGTGTTGEAAWREGMRAVLVEREAEYQADIRRRMALALSGPDERGREAAKARMDGKPRDDGPLFGGKSDWDEMWQRPFDYPERL